MTTLDLRLASEVGVRGESYVPELLDVWKTHASGVRVKQCCSRVLRAEEKQRTIFPLQCSASPLSKQVRGDHHIHETLKAFHLALQNSSRQSFAISIIWHN